jgi:hypothetical protein
MTESDVTLLVLPTLAWAYLERGTLDQASAVVAEAAARARQQGYGPTLAGVLSVQARVAIRQEVWQEAESALQEGLELARAMPYPYAEARLLHVDGAMHAQKGEPALARERLEAALALFRQLGARKDAERVAQALGDLEPGA